MKVSRTVWSRGKSGDNIKGLPIAIEGRDDIPSGIILLYIKTL